MSNIQQKTSNIYKSETLPKIREAKADYISYKRELLAGLLNQLTFDQQSFFIRLYKSVSELEEDRIQWAIVQCENTIRDNKITENSI